MLTSTSWLVSTKVLLAIQAYGERWLSGYSAGWVLTCTLRSCTFRNSGFSDTTSPGHRAPHSANNPLVRFYGLEIKCSVIGVLQLKPSPAQYGQVKHSQEGYPSLFTCKAPSYLLMFLLLPYKLCAAPSSEQLSRNHRTRCLRQTP